MRQREDRKVLLGHASRSRGKVKDERWRKKTADGKRDIGTKVVMGVIAGPNCLCLIVLRTIAEWKGTTFVIGAQTSAQH